MTEGWDVVARRVSVTPPVRLDEHGLTGPTPGQARGPSWRRTSAGHYVLSTITDDLVEQRIVEAASRLQTGAVTGWAALRLLGGGYFDGLASDGVTRLPVPLLAGRDRIRSRPGVQVKRCVVREGEVVTRYGVRCVIAERALFDDMRWGETLEDRVVSMDMAAAARLTSIQRMSDFARQPGQGVGRGDVLWSLGSADEGALSPQEVRLRLLWRRLCGGWTTLLCNPTVVDSAGRFVGMPDLLEVGTGLTGEFVGAVHRSRAQHRKDVDRADRFRRVGLEPVEFVGADLDDEKLVAARVQAARGRAVRNPREWFVSPDEGISLDDRLDLRDHLAAREAAYEGGQ